MSQEQVSPLLKATTGFSYCLSAIGACLLLPILDQYCRGWLYNYFINGVGYNWANTVAWFIIILMGVGVFFGGSALLQTIFYWLLTKSKKVRAPF